jgi:hypothetical protein
MAPDSKKPGMNLEIREDSGTQVRFVAPGQDRTSESEITEPTPRTLNSMM